MRKPSVKAFPVCLVTAVLVLLAACAAPGETPPPVTETPSSPPPPTSTPIAAPLLETLPPPSPETVPPAAQFPIEITDQLGRVVTIKKAPERIISLAPSNTEILFALGLGGKVVGRTDYCDYPAEAKTRPSIGSYSKPGIEKIVAAYPDLILATSIHKDQVIPVLERLGFTVVALAPRDLDGVIDSITLVGKVTGEQEEATELVNSLSDRVKAITDRTSGLSQASKPKVFYVLWYEPLMSSGVGTFQDDLIQRAGGTNIAQNLEGWKTISLEAVITANPEVIIAGDMSDGGSNYQFAANESRLQNTDARKNKRVYWINSDVASRPGPRIVEALEFFARYIHPEIFGEE